MLNVIQFELGRVGERVAANHKAEFAWDGKLVDGHLACCAEVDSGARNINHILNGTLLSEIAEVVLPPVAEGAALLRIRLSSGRNCKFRYVIK